MVCADESGSDSEGAESTSSSYSSLSDLIAEMTNSEIDGETPCEWPADWLGGWGLGGGEGSFVCADEFSSGVVPYFLWMHSLEPDRNLTELQ